MNAKVQAYIDAGKQIVKENEDLEAQAVLYSRREKLISLGLYDKGEVTYSEDYRDDVDECEWDAEKGKWRCNEIIVPEVTDEEYEAILKSEQIQKEEQKKGKFAVESKDDSGVNPSAENIVDTVARLVIIASVVIAVLAVIGTIVQAANYGEDAGVILLTGIILLVFGVVKWAFLKVLVNISRNLFAIRDELKKK